MDNDAFIRLAKEGFGECWDRGVGGDVFAGGAGASSQMADRWRRIAVASYAHHLDRRLKAGEPSAQALKGANADVFSQFEDTAVHEAAINRRQEQAVQVVMAKLKELQDSGSPAAEAASAPFDVHIGGANLWGGGKTVGEIERVSRNEWLALMGGAMRYISPDAVNEIFQNVHDATARFRGKALIRKEREGHFFRVLMVLEKMVRTKEVLPADFNAYGHIHSEAGFTRAELREAVQNLRKEYAAAYAKDPVKNPPPASVDAAGAWLEWQLSYMEQMEAAGAPLEWRGDWGISSLWDVKKLNGEEGLAWVDFMLKAEKEGKVKLYEKDEIETVAWFDGVLEAEPMTPEQKWHAVLDSIITQDVDNPGALYGGSRYGQPRQIVFLDTDTHFEALSRWRVSGDNLAHALHSTVTTRGRMLGLTTVFGPRWRAVIGTEGVVGVSVRGADGKRFDFSLLEWVKQETQKEAGGGGGDRHLIAPYTLAKVQSIMAEYAGDNSPIVGQNGRGEWFLTAVRSTRQLVTAELLSRSALTNLIDVATVMSETRVWRDFGLSRVRSLAYLARNLARSPGRNAEWRQSINRSLLALEGSMARFVSAGRLGFAFDEKSWTSGLSTQWLGANLFFHVIDSARHAAYIEIGGGLYAKALTTPWAELNARQKEQLSFAGIDDEIWGEWGKVPSYDIDGVVMPDYVFNEPPTPQQQRARRAWVGLIELNAGNRASPAPTTSKRALSGIRARRQTMAREGLDAFFSFWQHPALIFYQRWFPLISRLRTSQSPKEALAHFVVLSSLFGAAVYSLKGALFYPDDDDRHDMTTAEFWVRAVNQGGAFSIPGDAIATFLAPYAYHQTPIQSLTDKPLFRAVDDALLGGKDFAKYAYEVAAENRKLTEVDIKAGDRAARILWYNHAVYLHLLRQSATEQRQNQ